MSGQLAALVGRRILKESARNHFGQEDPYFEEVPASRLYRAFGKKSQKRRKAVPPGLSDNDAKILTQVKRRAYRLDYALFSLCGIRFGWSSAIALIPFAGDAADAGLALMVVDSCRKIDGGLPAHLRTMMLINIIIDFFIGLVPFVGDIADALYKCNTRNAIILEKYLREKGAKNLARERRNQPLSIDMSLPEEFDKNDDGVLGDPPNYDSPHASSSRFNHRGNHDVQEPQRVRYPERNRSKKGWFGRSKRRTEDLEQGGGGRYDRH